MGSSQQSSLLDRKLAPSLPVGRLFFVSVLSALREIMGGMSVEMMPSAREIALANVVVDIEKGAARVGWDHAPSIYALVPTALLLSDPNLPADIAEQLRAGWDGNDEHLSAIIQEDLADDDIEQVLAHLAWPETVPGAAITVERIVVPPEVEDEAPEDPEEALAFVANHPLRTDVRLAVGVLRSGESWCALRTRAFDSDDKVGQGSALVPALVDALRASLEPVTGEEA